MTAFNVPSRTADKAERSPGRSDDSGIRNLVWAVLVGVAVCLPYVGLGAWRIEGQRAAKREARAAYAARLASHDRLIASPPGPMLSEDVLVRGRAAFDATCAVCHTRVGTGLRGMGSDLTRSWFVASMDDRSLVGFVAAGRPADHPDNSTGVAMPPRGANDALTDEDLADIVAYMRALQDPRRAPALPERTIAGPSKEQEAQALAAAGGDAELAGYIAHGAAVFASTCSACHGKDARGVVKMGKDLVANEFVKTTGDDDLLAFIKRGRNPGDPLNTTKLDMPARGGNPALSDDDLLDVIEYLRSLQRAAKSGA
ncbi:MAG: c-type cytochrome [Phycisphaerae bacterium]|nr:c-type cytochrome [Phycisphaerae bacterium]